MMKKNYDLIKAIYVSLVIVALFICQILVTFSKLKYNEMFQGSILLAIIGGIGMWIYIFDMVLNNKKIDKYDILIYLLLLLGIVSTIFSINVRVSIFGFFTRNEGLLVIFTYYVIFLISKSIENKRYRCIILNIILIYGFLHGIYAISQYFGLKKICYIPVIRQRYYSTGFENNPNFLSTIALICLSISLSKFFIAGGKKNIVYGLVAVINFFTLIVSGATSGNLTFIIMIPVLLLITFLCKGNYKSKILKVLIIMIFFLGCFYIFNRVDNNYLMKQIKRTENEVSSIAKGKIDDKYGTGRIYIWKNGLKLAGDNLITGIGIDNFFNAYDDEHRLKDIRSGLYIDKLHNEYLQKLVTEGIFSLIIYLVLLLIIFIMFIKRLFIKNTVKDSQLIALFIAFMTYSIQAFFNISVIFVAPLYYIIMGLGISEVQYERN